MVDGGESIYRFFFGGRSRLRAGTGAGSRANRTGEIGKGTPVHPVLPSG